MLTSTQNKTAPVTPKPPQPAAIKENRRIQRLSLPLPVRIEMRLDAENALNEITRLSDVSAFGAGFVLKRPLKPGRLVLLTIPMPRQLRSFDYSETQYKIWGVVRRCISMGRSIEKPEYSIGVAFIGKNPPSSYIENPATIYDITHRETNGGGFWQVGPADLFADDSSRDVEARKQTRFSIPESLRLERTDRAGNVVETENTVTENISLGGAAVFTSMQAEPGTFLRVSSERFGVTILSVVRGQRVGKDGIIRLHIEFIDRLFPLEGIG